MVVFVTIEGNVGVGKSTLLEVLKKRSHDQSHVIRVVPEPIEEWRSPIVIDDRVEKTPLRFLYDDPERNGFSFQMYATHTRLCKLMDASRMHPSPEVIVMERSCMSRADVFGELVRQDFSPLEWHTYQATRAMARDIVTRVFADSVTHATVYLRTDPSECLRRMHVRGRPEECEHVTLQRMQEMHNLHESLFFASTSSTGPDGTVYTVDANRTVEAVANDVLHVINNILHQHP